MSDVVVVALISAVPAVIAAIGAFVAVFKVATVHTLINSRVDELVAATRSLAHAQGVSDERAERALDKPKE